MGESPYLRGGGPDGGRGSLRRVESIVERNVGGTRIAVVEGDITALEVDAVVNAANERLAHGGGVAAAIARAGAPVVQDESTRWVREHGPVGPGMSAVTGAGPMPADIVIHVVGPVYAAGKDNARLLTAAVDAALGAAAKREVGRVALPAISAGIFGYPMAEAAEVIVAAVTGWAAAHDWPREVWLVGFDGRAAAAFATALAGS
jgi:O-acetyl-ADP-ribose deacetylase (regulator of RNase III)